METLTLEELKTLQICVNFTWANAPDGLLDYKRYDQMDDKITQAISDIEFEQQSKPLNF